MNSVCYHVATGAGVREDFYIALENMPVIEDFTEETKGILALRILKNMKNQGLLKFVVYTEESEDENDSDKTIKII